MHGRTATFRISTGLLVAVAGWFCFQLLMTSDSTSWMSVAAVLVVLGMLRCVTNSSKTLGIGVVVSLSLLFAIVLTIGETGRGSALILGTVAMVACGCVFLLSIAVTESVPVEETTASASKLASSVEANLPADLREALPLVSDAWKEEIGEEAEMDSVFQQITRFQSHELDRIEGVTTVSFPANAKRTAVHLPFIPPMRCVPQGWCECESDPGIRTEFDAIHAYGARLALRRIEGSELACEVKVTFVLEADLSHQKAA